MKRVMADSEPGSAFATMDRSTSVGWPVHAWFTLAMAPWIHVEMLFRVRLNISGNISRVWALHWLARIAPKALPQ
jgi:hypothetical protein